MTQFNIKPLFVLSILLLLFSCRNKTYNYDEAVRSLKVLNSDLTNLFLEAEEKEELKALNFLWEQESAPLPSPGERFTLGRPYTPFDFNASAGIWFWNADSAKFFRKENNDKLIFNYPAEDFSDVRFLISKYESVPVSSRPEFPVVMDAQLWIDDAEMLTIEHSASVEDKLPLLIQSSVRGSDFEIVGNFNRSRRGNLGNLDSEFYMEYLNRKLIQLQFNSEIGYSRMGYYFEKIDFKINLFSHVVTGKIDYDKINPTSEDYASSFNSNSVIQIFELPGKRKVGDIVLHTLPDGEILDYFVKFSNGQMIMVNEHLPVLNKILNLKL
jgi:hypothetical protein